MSSQQIIRAVLAIAFGGAFGCLSVALRAADDWNGVASEVVGGVWFLALVICAILIEMFDLPASLSASAAFIGLLVTASVWATCTRSSPQIGVNFLLAGAVSGALLFGCWVGARKL